MLLLSAIATSMDSLFIGYSFRCNHTIFEWYHKFFFFIGLFLTFIFLHIFSQVFHIFIVNKYIKAILFLILGSLSFQKKETKNYSRTLSWKELIIIILESSIDGFLVSLTLISTYSIYYISLIFSGIGTLFLEIGNHFPYQYKKSEYVSFFLFLLLAICSLF